MESSEDFMHRFFAARTAEIKRELECRAPFRKQFFTADCFWDSRTGAVERSEAEIILEVSNFDNESRVITQEINPFPRVRYTLIPSGKSWLIQRVDVFIERHGWLGEEDLRKRIKASRQQ
jgi:hypothetical protein